MTPKLARSLEKPKNQPQTPVSVINGIRLRLNQYIEVTPESRVNQLEALLGTNSLVELNAKQDNLAVSIQRTEEEGMTYRVTINGLNQSLVFFVDKNGNVYQKPAVSTITDKITGKIKDLMGGSSEKNKITGLEHVKDPVRLNETLAQFA